MENLFGFRRFQRIFSNTEMLIFESLYQSSRTSSVIDESNSFKQYESKSKLDLLLESNYREYFRKKD